LATMILISGCSGYLRRRAADFADMARLNVGGGYGSSFDASVTRYARFSAGGYENVVKAGFVGRRGGVWKEQRQGVAFVAGLTETSREPICGNAFLPPPETENGLQPWYADKERGVTEISISLLVFGGLEVGFDPGQMLDFFLGWAGIDIYGDDGPSLLPMRRPHSELRDRKAGCTQRPRGD